MKQRFNKINIDCLKEIHESSLTPFIIFNNKKYICFINKSFLEKFNNDIDDKEQNKIDFLYQKNNGNLKPFSTIPLKSILNDTHIFSYFPKDKDEIFFYVSTFLVGEYEKEKFYYSIFKEITDLEEKLMEESIRALVIASQLKDNDTGNHVKRVNAYSYLLAKQLLDTRHENYPEIDMDFINKIFKVSSMHDVGKIGTPDYILTKPGKLNIEEFNIMKEHTINGAFILSKMAGQMARDIALFHHEKWDGSGYPYGLKEDQIPLSARIVALTDVYDALRMKRHYKPSFSHEEAKKIIINSKGTHFDPDIVSAFTEIEKKFNDIYEKMNDTDMNIIFHKDTFLKDN